VSNNRVSQLPRRGSKPGARRPTKRSKERQLQLYVMQVLGLPPERVLYESNTNFDLEISGEPLYFERTTADTWIRIGTAKQRSQAAQALARKYAQAARYMADHPGAKVWVVTDAELELIKLNPSRLLEWAGIRPVLRVVA
jgi:hypothetical protein